jgi:CRISPR-associated protein Cmr2
MEIQDWLKQHQNLYPELPEAETILATHPITGEWQNSPYLKNQFWWGGGASQEACQQLQSCLDSNLTQVGALVFGPVQSFLGSGQRLRDWAVASWLCHYLTGVLIYRWEEAGGKVLLPLHQSSPFLSWLKGESVDETFWQPELPNVITGLFPQQSNWLEDLQQQVNQEWGRFLQQLEAVSVKYESKLLNGIGWRVIHQDHQHLWSTYTSQNSFNSNSITEVVSSLHQTLEAQKIQRQWEGNWWGGRTSPSAGCLSIWHPGLKPVNQGGIWGLSDDNLKQWWEKAAEKSRLSGLFSEGDRLNSLEMVKRLASVPEIIESTLEGLWGKKPPSCPWGRFPDRTAVAAAWVTEEVTHDFWNNHVEILNEFYFEGKQSLNQWGMPKVDKNNDNYAHPRALERRNIEPEMLPDWAENVPKRWESTIEWTVGWRGDGDHFGKWLSGQQYQNLKLSWDKWLLDNQKIEDYHLAVNPPQIGSNFRQLELPHILDLSVLFNYWNRLLYPLVETEHNGKVIFAGGDDFLLLAPITEAVNLTNDLHNLWTGNLSSLTQPLTPLVDGWVKDHQEQIYPVPGSKMTFSLGLVIAQRRIPQSLWHRGLNYAYKRAKNEGRNRVCVQVLFNSGQSLEWVCPWQLWHLLMAVEGLNEDKTELNVWEKLLKYVESTRLTGNSTSKVKALINTLWASVGLSFKEENKRKLLQWEHIETIINGLSNDEKRDLIKVIGDWQWWLNWISLRGFLARQARDRRDFLQKFSNKSSNK